MTTTSRAERRARHAVRIEALATIFVADVAADKELSSTLGTMKTKQDFANMKFKLAERLAKTHERLRKQYPQERASLDAAGSAAIEKILGPPTNNREAS